MRCSTLAEAWLNADGGDVIVWGEIALDFVRARLTRIGARISQRRDLIPLEGVLVCDHYDRAVRAAIATETGFGIRVLVDDLGGVVVPGFDVVWNPNAYESGHLYPGFRGRILGGVSHVPIRPDIPVWTEVDSGGIAVTLGASDAIPDHLRAALDDLAISDRATPFCGVGNWLPQGWGQLNGDNPWPGIVRCRMLVTASGVTTWEAAKAGIPVVMLLLADNQAKIFEWAVASGAPGVDCRAIGRGDLRDALADSIGHAQKLPALENMAPHVTAELRECFKRAMQ
jgi:hypothetical protein